MDLISTRFSENCNLSTYKLRVFSYTGGKLPGFLRTDPGGAHDLDRRGHTQPKQTSKM